MVFLLDTKDRSGQLRTNLTDLRRKWVEAGRELRTETIRGKEFARIAISTNDVPSTLRKFMPGKSDVEELRSVESTSEMNHELLIGQVDSLLVVSSSKTSVEKIVARLTGGTLPPLAEVQEFDAVQGRMFRKADAFGWLNTKVLLDLFTQSAKAKDANEAPDPLAVIQPANIVRATGLGAVKSASFAYRHTSSGSEMILNLAAPESERSGVLRVLAGEAKDTAPPPFVPADVTEFHRWRIDGQKSYATLEQMIAALSPQMLNTINFVIQTADMAGKQHDPNFDLKEQLVGNLGDDVITYEKAPRSSDASGLAEPPSLILVGSKNPEQMMAAASLVTGILGRGAGTTPKTREFLGTTIHLLELPAGNPAAGPNILSFAATRGYVAISKDEAILEEFLRSSDSPSRPLRQLPGLAEAIEQVREPGTSVLSFENQKEGMRTYFDALRRIGENGETSQQSGMTPIGETLGVGMPRKGLAEWFDFSLLPEYSKLEKYFHFLVSAGSASADGLTMKLFAPVPPEVRAQTAEAN
jgi:hypothetical protein